LLFAIAPDDRFEVVPILCRANGIASAPWADTSFVG
jgi:hypothetical protein